MTNRSDRECAADGCDYKLGHNNESGYCTRHLKKTPAYLEKQRDYHRTYKEKKRQDPVEAEKIRANHKKWRDANPDKVKSAQAKANAKRRRKPKAEPAWCRCADQPLVLVLQAELAKLRAENHELRALISWRDYNELRKASDAQLGA